MPGGDDGPALHEIEPDGQAFEEVRRDQLDDDADDGDGPYHREQPEPPGIVHLDEHERGVGAGDHEEDRRVVEAAEQLFQLRRPDDQIVAGGAAEHGDERRAVDGEAHHPERDLRLYADDEKNGERDEAGGNANDVDAPVGHALAHGVVGKHDATFYLLDPVQHVS